jgi:hypothetical protein
MAGTEEVSQKPSRGVVVEPPFWDLRRRRRKRFIATQPPSKYVDSIQAFDVSKHANHFYDLKCVACAPYLCFYSWSIVNNRFICLILLFSQSFYQNFNFIII